MVLEHVAKFRRRCDRQLRRGSGPVSFRHKILYQFLELVPVKKFRKVPWRHKNPGIGSGKRKLATVIVGCESARLLFGLAQLIGRCLKQVSEVTGR